MSGVEVAGLILGVIPLIISGLEQRKKIARAYGNWTRIWEEHRKCLAELKYHTLLYEKNLTGLLSPIVADPKDILIMINDPNNPLWKSETLETQLQERLYRSYAVYMQIVEDKNEAFVELYSFLCPEDVSVQNYLQSPSRTDKKPNSFWKSAKSKMSSQKFRFKFTTGDSKRNEIFSLLNECNERLEKLLGTSAPPTTAATMFPKPNLDLGKIFKRARKGADLLFRAMQAPWECSCWQHHLVNIRLEHRTLSDIYFDIILMSTSSSSKDVSCTSLWEWKELRCGQMNGCPFSQASALNNPSVLYNPNTIPRSSPTPITTDRASKKKQVAFASTILPLPSIELDVPTEPGVQLCERLGHKSCGNCLGLIGNENEKYHLHPISENKPCSEEELVTLDDLLSPRAKSLSRQQRYRIALLLASSVAQLQSTEWLRIGLTKTDVLFFHSIDEEGNSLPREPYIRQGFRVDSEPGTKGSSSESTFYSLGVLLLELCFGLRFEDHPERRLIPEYPREVQIALDQQTAWKWYQEVGEEAGSDFALAVEWCLKGASTLGHSWRDDIIRHVVQPLELSQVKKIQ